MKINGNKTYLAIILKIVVLFVAWLEAGNVTVARSFDLAQQVLPWLAALFAAHKVSKIKK